MAWRGHWATDNDQNYLSCAASLGVWKLFSRFSVKAHLRKQHHFNNNLGSCCWGNFVADKQVWKRPETQERQVENIVRGIIYWDVKSKFDKNLCQSQLGRGEKALVFRKCKYGKCLKHANGLQALSLGRRQVCDALCLMRRDEHCALSSLFRALCMWSWLWPSKTIWQIFSVKVRGFCQEYCLQRGEGYPWLRHFFGPKKR